MIGNNHVLCVWQNEVFSSHPHRAFKLKACLCNLSFQFFMLILLVWSPIWWFKIVLSVFLRYFLNRAPSVSSPCSFSPPSPVHFFLLPVSFCLLSLLFPVNIPLLFPSPSFPMLCFSPWSSPGSPSSSSAGIFPDSRVLPAIWPVSGSRDLPHGADALLDSGAHVGRQLPHCSTPPWGSSYFCLQQDPRLTQH